jgi:hypothetical protein
MKAFTMLCLAAEIICTNVIGQQPYPTATDRGNIVYLEYFIDHDPGPGKGVPVPVSAARNLSSLNVDIDISGISKAWHRLYFRSRNADGGWSLCAFSLFDNVEVPAYPNAPAPESDIVEMEYYIDNDPGFGKGIKIPAPSSPDVNKVTVPVDISNLSKGIHRLLLRSRNSLHQWSLTHVGVFDNTASLPYPTAPPPGPVTQMEYFIDNDPGFGNARPISFTAAPDIHQLSVDVDLTGLSNGQHTLYLRSREFPWSHTMAVSFSYGSSLPVTWLYVRGERKQQQALISWATSQELNTDRFIVEYSRDGKSYTAVSELPAAGNSSSSRTYAYTYPQLQSGVNYFRLKQVDKDGRFSYSSIIVIPYAERSSMPMLIPNPVDRNATLLIPPAFEATELRIFDAAGKSIRQEKITEKNVQHLFLQLGTLPKGVYVLQVKGKQQNHSIRFIKN